MAIERLSGGLTPADGSDPRTFPAIWNEAADLIDEVPGKAPLLLVENVQADDYTLALSDSAKVVAIVGATGGVTVTVPDDASVAFPVGTVVNVYRGTSESVTVEGAGGVTVRNEGDISEEFAEVSLRKRGADEWVLVGQVG